MDLNQLFNSLGSEMDAKSEAHHASADAIGVSAHTTQQSAMPTEFPPVIDRLRLNLKSLLCEAGCYSGITIAAFQGIDRVASHALLPIASLLVLSAAVGFCVSIAQINRLILRAWRYQDVDPYVSSISQWNLSLGVMQEAIARLVLLGQLAIALMAGLVVSLVV